ncbi:MAG: hypothetical protein WCI79_00095 [Candidatus Saccharibacteria bacterium]
MTNYKNPYQDEIFSLLPGKAILVHPVLKDVTGTLNAAIWLSQMLFLWGRKRKHPDEVYKSRNKYEEETRLSRDQQIRAENRLKKLGIINITVKSGCPSLINHITINSDVLKTLISNVLKTRTLEEQGADVLTSKSTSAFKVNQCTQNTDNIPEITQKNIQRDIKDKNSGDNSGHLSFKETRERLGI